MGTGARIVSQVLGALLAIGAVIAMAGVVGAIVTGLVGGEIVPTEMAR